MKDNRGTTILLTVIGIATLLVAVVGATFAYFTAGVESTDESIDTNVTINSATVGTITFTHSNIIDLCDDSIALAEGQTCVIYPGAQETKEFTVKADANSTTKVAYDVYLQVLENSFVTENGLGYKVSATSTSTEEGVTNLTAADDYAPMDLTASQTFKTGAKVKIASGVLGTAGATDTWSLDVAFENNPNADQNDDQGAKFSAKIIVEASSYTKDGEIYTTTVAGA